MASIISSRRVTVGLALVVVLASGARSAGAQAPTDQRVWTAVATQGRFTEDSTWTWAADAFLRARDGVHTMDSAAARLSVGRDVTSAVRVMAGYAWGAAFPDGGSARREHRLHQQAVWAGRAAGLRVSTRSRIEERFIEGAGGIRVRARQQVRVAWAIGSSGLQAVASEEVLVNVTATGGASRGVDGNRAFAGVRRSLTSRSALEVGYLHVYTPGRSAPGRHSHVVSTVLSVGF